MTTVDLVAESEKMAATGGRIEGGSPLAGHHGLPSLLVREAVQNAWDARDDARGDRPVHFSIDGHDLDTDSLDALRTAMPVQALEGFDRTSDDEHRHGVLHPAVVLRRSSVRVLVLSDRGTVGLCGPSQSGTAWEPVRHGAPLLRGQQRFANFIRNIGRASANIGEGDGGSYGVGKSALWMASECGTTLIHTRTTGVDGEPVERFIGTVHGEYFAHGGLEYTGRHFIGRAAEGGVVDPVEGADAAALGRSLPIPPYVIDGEQVDGTSIVIVAPRLHLDWELEMNRLRDAVRWQVWPKRVPGVREPNGGPDMSFSLSWNNHDVALPDPLDDGEIRPYARALLDCARDRNHDEDGRDFVAECHRPKTRLGVAKFRTAGPADSNVFHLTVDAATLEEQSGDDDLVDDEPAVDFGRPWGQIALIRREPLLLVQYQPIGGPDATGEEVGVFLSADDPAVEAALTKAEPPAHDEWNHKLVPKDHSRDHRKTLAKRTTEEIRRVRNAFGSSFRSVDEGAHGHGEQTVARRLARGLMGGLGGGPGPKKPSSGGGGRAPRPAAVLQPIKTYEVGDGTVHEVEATISGVGSTPVPLVLTAGGNGVDNDGPLGTADRITFSWLQPSGEQVDGSELRREVADGASETLLVKVTGDVRFRPKVTVEVDDGD